MWSRNSPFTLISIGGERHSKDPRFWVEEPDVNNTSKQSWVSFSDEFKLKFSKLSRAELGRFRAESSQAGVVQFLSWNQADSMYVNKKQGHVKNYN